MTAGLAGLVLLSCAERAPPTARQPACAARTEIALLPGKTFACTAAARAGRSYFVSVDQTNVDVALTISTPGQGTPLELDAPTRRALPETALVEGRAGSLELALRAAEPVRRERRVVMEIRELEVERATSAWGRAQAAFTRAASAATTEPGGTAPSRADALTEALDLATRAREAPVRAEAQYRLAAERYRNGDWAGTTRAAAEAARLYAAANDALMAARARMLRAAALVEQHSPLRSEGEDSLEAAPQLLLASRELFRDARSPFDEAHAVNHLGISLHYQGRFEEAAARYAEAAGLFEEIGEPEAQILPLQNLAVLAYDRGDYESAARTYERLLDAGLAEGDVESRIVVQTNLGTARSVLGDYDGALRALVAALRLAESADDVPGQARALHALGRLYATLGERERAAVLIERALELWGSRAQGDRRSLVATLLYLGELRREHDPRAALALHRRALDQVTVPLEQARVHLDLGYDHLALGDVSAARAAFEAGRALTGGSAGASGDGPNPIEVRLSAALGTARLAAGDESGRALLERSAETHLQQGETEQAARAFLLLARHDGERGRLKSAESQLARSLALYERQRVTALNPDLRATYLGSRAEAYDLQAELLLARAEAQGSPRARSRLLAEALQVVERRRVSAIEDFRALGSDARTAASPRDTEIRALDRQLASRRHRLERLLDQPAPSVERISAIRRDIELLRTRIDVLQREADRVAPRVAQVSPLASVASIQQRLADDSVALTFLLGEDRGRVFVVRRDAIEVATLPGRAEVEGHARLLHEIWSRPPASAAITQQEQAASRALLAPIESHLAGKRSVIVVADGALRALPFAALLLHDEGSNGAVRLGERYGVVYRPALGPLAGAKARDDAVPAQRRILLVGDPRVEGPQDGEPIEAVALAPSIEPLPGARRELREVAAIARAWQPAVLGGAAATKAALLRQPLESFHALHFATHARMDARDPQLSTLVLSGRAAGIGGDAALSLREIMGLPLDAETVVLSACEGSLGKHYRGQLSFGLSEAFLLAGARSVVGSLWRVSDLAAQRYMRAFYEAYAGRGASPAQATQLAAQALRAERRFAHPYFWAAFQIVEN